MVLVNNHSKKRFDLGATLGVVAFGQPTSRVVLGHAARR